MAKDTIASYQIVKFRSLFACSIQTTKECCVQMMAKDAISLIVPLFFRLSNLGTHPPLQC
jgi:hypothetical protein